MGIKMVGIALLALVLVSCNNPPLPRFKATLGTYSVREGQQDKLGIALMSSFDPGFPIPKEGFEIHILGPEGLRANHVFRFPSQNKSDWFADPDIEAKKGNYTVVAKIGGRQYQMTTQVDTDSWLDYPEVLVEQPSDDRVEVSWDPVEDSEVYYVTLNQKIPGQVKPLIVQEVYTKDLSHTFKKVEFKVNIPYFVAVGALNLDPRIAHNRFSKAFNTSYGQSSQDLLVDEAGIFKVLPSDSKK